MEGEVKLNMNEIYALVRDIKETRTKLKELPDTKDNILIGYRLGIMGRTLNALINDKGLGGIRHFLDKQKTKLNIDVWEENVAKAIKEGDDDDDDLL